VIDAATIADRLIEAERRRTPVAPFTAAHPFLDTETAYKAQWLFVEHRIEGGETLVGTKLGLTSRVKRVAMGIHEPLYGRLTSGMMAPHGEALALDRLISPRAEPEIAFLIGAGMDAPASVASVLAATDMVFGAIEIIDSRYGGNRFRLADSIADNAGAAKFAVGPRARRPDEIEDLRLLGCVLRSRGEVVATAASGAAMGHPAAAVAWLVNTLASRGQRLAAGSLVLTGGLTTPVPLRPRGLVSAEFDGLGSVAVFS
jgi:2-oxo-3-hexenedioate decarboxylase